MMFTTVGISLLLGLLYLATAQEIIIPPELQRVMAGIDSMDSFMRAMNLGNITIKPVRSFIKPNILMDKHWSLSRPKGPNKQSFLSRRKPKIMKVELSRTGVMSFSGSSSTPVKLENVMCKTYPTVVNVPQPDHNMGFHFPMSVMLHRCAGSCNTKPRVHECVASEIQNISLIGIVVAWNSPKDKMGDLHRAPLFIPMVNHTKCACKCITKPAECDPATQTFVEGNCRCECKVQSKRCPIYHRWDRVRCKCVCDPPRVIYCPRRFDWNPDKCMCACKTTLCRLHKVRNPTNCRCYCSKKLPSCPKGFARDRRNCKCKQLF